jgi:hypothetical protein
MHTLGDLAKALHCSAVYLGGIQARFDLPVLQGPAYPGAIYHMLNRGDRWEPIFRDDAETQRFLETLGDACARSGWQVHAYSAPPKGNRQFGLTEGVSEGCEHSRAS